MARVPMCHVQKYGTVAFGTHVHHGRCDVEAAPIRWQYQNEREWQRYVIELAKRYGWKVFHHQDSRRTTRGWPDLALLRPPDFILAELKMDTTHVTRWQGDVLLALKECGVEVHVWRPMNEDAMRERLSQRRDQPCKT